MATPQYTTQKAGDRAALSRYTRYYWIPRRAPSSSTATDGFSGLTQTGKSHKFIGLLCTLKTADAVKFTPVEEFEFLGGGKDPQKVSFGKQVEFGMEIAGNDLATLRAFIGRNQGVSTVNSWEPEIQYPASGHLLVNSYNYANNELVNQTLYMNLQVKFEEFAGMDTSGERTQKVMFFNTSARIVKCDVAMGERINVEGWYDDGLASLNINAAAPDGTITAFVLGTGNGVSAGTPVALRLDSTNAAQTGYKQWMIEATVDGATVPLTGNSFTTSTFTFTTPPADGKHLMLIYVNDPALTTWPNYSGDPDTVTATDTELRWSDYMTA